MVISKLIIYHLLVNKIKRKCQHHSLLLFSQNMQNTKINAIVTKSAFLIFGNISKMLRFHFRRLHCYYIRVTSNNMTFSSVDPAWNAFYSHRVTDGFFSFNTFWDLEKNKWQQRKNFLPKTNVKGQHDIDSSMKNSNKIVIDYVIAIVTYIFLSIGKFIHYLCKSNVEA